VITKAVWFIERVVMEVRGLRESVEILKGQKRVVMKERDGLRERLEGYGDGENNLMGKTT
jgi:hypothetical protein